MQRKFILISLLFILSITVFIVLSYTNGEQIKQDERLAEGVKADKVTVYKSARKMDLLRGGKVLKTYKISLGKNPVGHKEKEGDSRTPEGKYILDWRNPESKYHLSIHVSYPDAKDREAAKRLGVPPGGDIMIHGCPNGLGWNWKDFKERDWTDGCIAVNDEEMEEIWRAVDNGTPIEILP